jgi:outer membrane protein OmpA-like peptidoglycan-associated protein
MSAFFASHRQLAAGALIAGLLAPACSSHKSPDVTPAPRVVTRDATPATTSHDKTVKGAGIGAATGAATAILVGKREADQILIGSAIGAVAGAGVGAYLDAQERKITRIPGTTVERTDDDTLLVRFDSDVLFPAGSAKPTAQSLSMLGELGDVLVGYPKTAVVVQGFTDSTGGPQLNQELSERRALAVKDILTERGVDSRRIAAIGHGEQYPIASNGFEDGRRRNRRVTILLKSRT